MPFVANPQNRPGGTAISADLGYSYPLNLNLRPDSDFHNRTISRLMDMVLDATTSMRYRHESWKKIDQTLSAFVVSDDMFDNSSKGKNNPIEIVVPMSYATLDTLLAHWVSVFTNGPLFRYRGMGPEDKTKAMLLELAIDSQTKRMKTLLNLHTQWRDAIAYGLGVVHVRWEQQHGQTIEVKEQNFFSSALDAILGTEKSRTVSGNKLLYEANALDNWDVYNYIIDPNVPVTDVQKAQYVGYIERTDYYSLLTLERNDPDTYFNVRYLKGAQWISPLRTVGGWTDVKRRGQGREGVQNNIGDLIKLYATIIPKDWGLGRSKYPEKWLFEIAGGTIMVRAQPLNLAHNMYPVAVISPTYDGHTTAPISTLEMVLPMQEAIDWFYKSHVHNVRKTLNNMFIIDPYLVDYSSAANPEPGKLMTMRHHVWGRGVKDAIQQLPVTDATRGHIGDMGATIDMLQRVTGAVDTLQGITRTGGERRSATEMRDTRMSALNRIQKSAMLGGLQSQQDIGFMFAKHLQQFMELPMYLDLVGENQAELRGIYEDESTEFDPLDFVCQFDMIVGDGSTPGGEFLAESLQMFQQAQANPETAAAFDFVRWQLDLMRKTGIKSPTDFLKRDFRLNILPDEQAAERADEIGAQPVQTIPGLEGSTNLQGFNL